MTDEDWLVKTICNTNVPHTLGITLTHKILNCRDISVPPALAKSKLASDFSRPFNPSPQHPSLLNTNNFSGPHIHLRTFNFPPRPLAQTLISSVGRNSHLSFAVRHPNALALSKGRHLSICFYLRHDVSSPRLVIRARSRKASGPSCHV